MSDEQSIDEESRSRRIITRSAGWGVCVWVDGEVQSQLEPWGQTMVKRTSVVDAAKGALGQFSLSNMSEHKVQVM